MSEPVSFILSPCAPIALALGADFESRPEQGDMGAEVRAVQMRNMTLARNPKPDGEPKRAPLGIGREG